MTKRFFDEKGSSEFSGLTLKKHFSSLTVQHLALVQRKLYNQRCLKPVSIIAFLRVYAKKWATRVKVFGVSWYWF
jgi:hypothetical protein